MLTQLENQISPLYIDTPDGERLYAWHILPLGVYTRNEASLQKETFRTAGNFTKSDAFRILKEDPESRLVINCKF